MDAVPSSLSSYYLLISTYTVIIYLIYNLLIQIISLSLFRIMLYFFIFFQTCKFIMDVNANPSRIIEDKRLRERVSFVVMLST